LLLYYNKKALNLYERKTCYEIKKNQKENGESKEISNITEDNIKMYLDGKKVDEIKLANEGNFEVKVEF